MNAEIQTNLNVSAADYAVNHPEACNYPGRVICNAFKAGAEWAQKETILEVLKIIDKWHQAYPEDVFTPLPKNGTPEAEAQDNALVTRASAHMGRHITEKLREEILGLIENKPQ